MTVALGAPAVVGAQVTSPTTAPNQTTTTAVPAAKAELVVDLSTGRVMYAQNDHARLPPASLTKLVTALIAVAWVPAKAAVPVSAAAANVYPDKVGMKAGQKWPFPVVLKALLVDSANDAAYALAEKIGRSLKGFGPIMATAAAQMGMSDHPVFRDPAGLDGTEGVAGGNLMSVWDVAIAARDLLANPTLRSIVAMRTYTFKGPDGIVYALDNKNHYFLDTYPGAIGVKTGFTDPAGLCIAAAATRGGRTLLAVVMNGASTYQTAEDLLNQGFAKPAAAEAANAPTLPAVHEPTRPAPTRPPTSTTTLAPQDPPTAAAVVAATGGDGGLPRWLRRPTTWDWVDLGLMAVAAALVIRQVRRARRRRPIGAHSRTEGG